MNLLQTLFLFSSSRWFIPVFWLETFGWQARREKISERMKILQDLVPGCNKVCYWTSLKNQIESSLHIYSLISDNLDNDVDWVLFGTYPKIKFGYYSYVCLFRFQVIGKALVLDEIINYIQSLQRQVEVITQLGIVYIYITWLFLFKIFLHSIKIWSM